MDKLGVDDLIDGLIAREGGYVANPADKGGPTRFGITQAVARAQGYAGDMARLPEAEAAAIYRRLYWLKPGLDRIAPLAPRLAAELFDTGVNMGPAVAAGFLRRTLNALNRGASDYPDIATGGTIDDAVVTALKGFLARRGASGETVLLKALDALQGARYVALAEARPADEAFLYGCSRTVWHERDLIFQPRGCDHRAGPLEGTMAKALPTLLLLCCSNLFMTAAWYGHLRFPNSKLWIAILASWGIALVEYCFAVPANRIGHAGGLTAGQLKIMQECVTLCVFALFATFVLKEPLGWRYLGAGACIAGAAAFVFVGR